MTLWPERLALRLLVALAVAAALLALLAVFVECFDGPPAPTLRGEPRRATAASPPSESVRFRSGSARLSLQPLAATARVAVAVHASSLPPDVAPVVEVLADGSLALRRPAPLPVGPDEVPPTSRDGFGAAVLLPAAPAALQPRQRAAWFSVLGRWLVARPVAATRLQPLDVEWPLAQMRRDLGWLP